MHSATTVSTTLPPGATVGVWGVSWTHVMLMNGAVVLFDEFPSGWAIAFGAETTAGATTAAGWVTAEALEPAAVRTPALVTGANAPAPTNSNATRITARVAVVPSVDAQNRRIGQVTTFIT